MQSFKDMLLETSLSRVWSHFNSDETVVILTAFRGDLDRSKNIAGNRKISSQLQAKKFGHFYVEGHWVEDQDGKKVDVSEDSIFATAPKERGDELIELAHKLANQYNQDAILVRDSNKKTYLYFKDGKKEDLGSKPSIGKMGSMYTKLRNNKKTNTFIFEELEPSSTDPVYVFESTKDDYGFAARLASEKYMSEE